MRRLWVAVWVLVGVGFLACPSKAVRPPETAAAPPGVKLPPGCEANLSGGWVHAEDPTYQYEARDDGGTVELSLRHPGIDAGVTILLHREPEAFTGWVR